MEIETDCESLHEGEEKSMLVGTVTTMIYRAEPSFPSFIMHPVLLAKQALSLSPLPAISSHVQRPCQAHLRRDNSA